MQGRGSGCYVADVSLPNAVSGIDFGSYPTDGHSIESVRPQPCVSTQHMNLSVASSLCSCCLLLLFCFSSPCPFSCLVLFFLFFLFLFNFFIFFFSGFFCATCSASKDTARAHRAVVDHTVSAFLLPSFLSFFLFCLALSASAQVLLSNLPGVGIHLGSSSHGWVSTVQGNMNAWKSMMSLNYPEVIVKGMKDEGIPWPAQVRAHPLVSSRHGTDIDTSLLFGGTGVLISGGSNEHIMNSFMHGPSTHIKLATLDYVLSDESRDTLEAAAQGTSGGVPGREQPLSGSRQTSTGYPSDATRASGAVDLFVINGGGEPGHHQIVAEVYTYVRSFAPCVV